MSIVAEQEGSQTATVGNEHQLGTETTSDEMYVAVLDVGAMVSGDVVKWYVKTKIRSSGTLQLAYEGFYSHAQVHPNKYTPPIPNDVALDVYLKQTAGTGRAFPWKLLAIAGLTVEDEGSQTATVTTLHQLGSNLTGGKSYLLGVDLVNLANGDYLELYAKTKARSGGTERAAYRQTYSHAQARLNVYSPMVLADIHCAFYLKQTAGTGRAFPWKIYSV